MRDRLCKILKREYDVVAALDGGTAVLENSKQLRPDVIILDISIPVVFVSQHTGSAYVSAAFDSGASGYVSKPRILTELYNALEEVRAGRTYLSADLRPK